MVMVIIGILAAVSIPRFADIVRQSEVAAEQGILINLVAALDTYSQEQFIENGVMSWPENPFESLNKVPQAYDQTGTVLMRDCLLYTSPSPRDQRGSRMPSSA